ncbi:MAG: hypothetical protein M2R45_02490 [Verrucomicrobia subdivision 3 bacterium]|nr:hypothetical protein [Limisphaerales bacterium]MCS1413280.1 hypothetical protein [Limisphaerales bacterium]
MRPKPSFSVTRRPVTIINMVVSFAAAIIIVGTVNYLAARHPLRVKWTQQNRFDLSPLTAAILDGLTNHVDVIVYANRDDATALHTSINGLLKEYAYRSPLVNVRHVDYVRDRQAALEVSERYELADRSPSDLVIFDAGKRFRLVTHQELRDYRTIDHANALLQGQREVKRVGFKGELLFTSAILNTTSGEAFKIAYLTGHGEHDLESEGLQGYSEFRQALEEKNFQVQAHHLINDGSIPADTKMLIIAGPRHPLVKEEIQEIDRFLQGGGCLLLLFNYNGLGGLTGLEDLMRRWGINVSMNVVDDIHKLMGSDLAIADFEDHPVTTPLADAKAGLLMFLPRSIYPLPQQALIQSRELTSQGIAYTSTNGVTRSDLQGGRWQFSHYRDRRGAIPVLSAVETVLAPTPSARSPQRTRLLVAGDSFFLSNSRIQQYGNRNFATLAAGWLTDQFRLLQGIGPQPLYEFKLTVPDRDLKRLQWLMLMVLPGAVFAVGLIVWWQRRV